MDTVVIFTIHREKEHDRVIRMGQASVAVPVYPIVAEVVPDPPITPPVEPKRRGRPKKMAKEKEEKMDSKSGVDVTRQDDAKEQGAIGSHGQNAPAQDRQKESDHREGKDE